MRSIAAFVITFIWVAFPWDSASGQAVNLARVDAALTATNSTFVSFGNGPTLQIPAYLLEQEDAPSSLKSPRRVRSISFGFMFPTMAPSFEVVGENIVWDTIRKKPKKFRSDEFPVAVMKVFFRPPDGKFAQGTVPLQSSPAEIEKHSLCCGFAKDGKTPILFEMTRVPTGLSGIDNLISTPRLQRAPTYHFNFKNDARYISTDEFIYELSMTCDGQAGVRCHAYVLSKRTHFQYDLIFPSESVEHITDVLDAVDKIFLSWART